MLLHPGQLRTLLASLHPLNPRLCWVISLGTPTRGPGISSLPPRVPLHPQSNGFYSRLPLGATFASPRSVAPEVELPAKLSPPLSLPAGFVSSVISIPPLPCGCCAEDHKERSPREGDGCPGAEKRCLIPAMLSPGAAGAGGGGVCQGGTGAAAMPVGICGTDLWVKFLQMEGGSRSC